MFQRLLTGLLRRTLPHAVLSLFLTAWWVRTAQPLLTLVLGWTLGWLLLHALALGLRVPARWRRWKRNRRPLGRGWLVPLVTVAGAAAVPALVLGFSTPAGWDFPVHTWHAHVLANELFPWLRGWTWSQNHGWAEGDDYALLAYLPAALLHLFTLKLVSIEAAVALEVAAVTVAFPVVVAGFLGRGLPFLAVLSGALLVLVDPGFFHAGGLVPLAVAGMWPVRLSMTLCVASMWAAEKYVRNPQPRALVVLMVLVALAAQSHVAGVTYVGVALVLWWVVTRKDGVTWRTWALVTAGCGAAMGTAAWLVLPFYALRDLQAELGEGNAALQSFWGNALELKWFERILPLELALALAGCGVLVRRRHLAGRMAVAGLLLTTVWLCLDVLKAVAPQAAQPLLDRVQWARYDVFSRNPLLFCAGVALALGLAWCARWFTHPRRDMGTVFLACATLGLLSAAATQGWPALWNKSQLKRVHQTPLLRELEYAPGLLEAAQWLAQRATPDTLLVVDTPLRPEPSAHVAGWLAMQTGLRVMAVHRQGTFVFRDFGPRDGKNNHTELAASGATHWLSVGWPSSGGHLMKELQAFSGEVRIYELPRWSPDQRVSRGDVKVVAWEQDRIVVEGPASGYDVALRARWHPRWEAVTPGVSLQTNVLLGGSRPIFMRLVVQPGDGRAELRYGPAVWGVPGLLLSLVALGLAVGCWWLSRRWTASTQASLRMSSTSPSAPQTE